MCYGSQCRPSKVFTVLWTSMALMGITFWSTRAESRKTSGMSEHNRSLWSEEEVVARDEGCEFSFSVGQMARSDVVSHQQALPPGTMLHHWSWVGHGLW